MKGAPRATVREHIPTTREIAVATGFNQSTVSRALRNDPRLPGRTKHSILKAARKMGWRPNPLAAAYIAHINSTGRPKYVASIGYFITHGESNRLEELPYYQQACFDGARRRARTLGYTLDPIWIHEPGMTPARLSNVLRERGIPGVIIPGILSPTTILAGFHWRHFSAVAINYSLQSPILHRVCSHVTQGISAALLRIRMLGYKRIGVVLSKSYDRWQNHGLLQALYFEKQQPWGKSSLKTYIFQEQTRKEHEGIRRWIEKEKPDVILGEEIVWQVLQGMKWEIPGDVSYVSLDWSPCWPIGGINQRHEVIGALAVEMVSSQLLRNERGVPAIPTSMLVEGVWQSGKSIPPVTPHV